LGSFGGPVPLTESRPICVHLRPSAVEPSRCVAQAGKFRRSTTQRSGRKRQLTLRALQDAPAPHVGSVPGFLQRPASSDLRFSAPPRLFPTPQRTRRGGMNRSGRGCRCVVVVQHGAVRGEVAPAPTQYRRAAGTPDRGAARPRGRRFPSRSLTNGLLGGSGRGPIRSHRSGSRTRSSSP